MSPITEDAKLLKNLLESQSDLVELYTEPTYDELKEALQNFINPSDDTETSTTSNGVTASTTPTTNTGTTKTNTKKEENVEDAFDQLFNS